MRTHSSLPLFFALCTGCFGSHGDPGDDAGVPPADGGSVWTECFDALNGARDGDACDFDESCGDVLPGCDGEDRGREVLCLSGRVQFFERTCTLAPWESCSAYLEGGGVPGSPCTEGFGVCTDEPGEDCCARSVTCEGGIVSDVVACASECGETMDCEGYDGPPADARTCRDAAGCDSIESCVPPGVSVCGGACQITPDECDADADCPDDHICLEHRVACACDAGVGHSCVPRCTADGCEDGFTCSDAGWCEPARCTDGFACAHNMRCLDEPPLGFPDPNVDVHGCERLACEGDADCDCGACVEGRCYDGPGVCEPPRP